jgi:hypothetical protein
MYMRGFGWMDFGVLCALCGKTPFFYLFSVPLGDSWFIPAEF